MLDRESLRLLGCLMEKEMTTPDLYPLSLNTLLAAANQRSSRDPVMELGEEDVRTALDRLAAQELVSVVRDGGRVPRFEHRIRTVLALRRDETAILCLLFLRGAQTPGELRSRSDRMFAFEDLAQIQATLERLAAREQSLVGPLPRQPGSREVRWTHRLGDTDFSKPPAGAETPAARLVDAEDLAALLTRFALLEQRVSQLEGERQPLQEQQPPHSGGEA